MLTVPVLREAKGEDHMLESRQSTLVRPCLRVKNKKGWGCGSRAKPWVQPLMVRYKAR